MDLKVWREVVLLEEGRCEVDGRGDKEVKTILNNTRMSM